MPAVTPFRPLTTGEALTVVPVPPPGDQTKTIAGPSFVGTLTPGISAIPCPPPPLPPMPSNTHPVSSLKHKAFAFPRVTQFMLFSFHEFHANDFLMKGQRPSY